MFKAIAIGHVVRDARVNAVSDKQDALNFTLAENRSYVSNGERVDVPNYVDVTIFGPKGKLNAMAEKLIIKGQGLSVDGRIQTDVKRDEQGNFLSSNTYIVAEIDAVEPMGKRPAAA